MNPALRKFPTNPLGDDDNTPIEGPDLMMRRSLFSLASRTRVVVWAMMGVCMFTLTLNMFLVYWLTTQTRAGIDANRQVIAANRLAILQTLEMTRRHVAKETP